MLGVGGVSPVAGCEATAGPERGDFSAASGRLGLFSPPGDAAAAGGEANEPEARCAWLGRRGGGGAGAWMLTRRLEERDGVESTDERLIRASASSWRSVAAALGTVLLPDRPCGCRLGGGGGFLAAGVFDTTCDAFGGVGGLGDMMFSPGSKTLSGTLPAASRSNTFSASSSAGDRCGEGGSGLLMLDDGVGGLCLDGDAPLAKSVLISFPCRELGGGGGFRWIAGAGCKLDWETLANPRSPPSPSRPESSWDVRDAS